MYQYFLSTCYTFLQIRQGSGTVIHSLYSCSYSGMIRLQGGSYSNQGRVEVYCNGQWGTICDDGFSSTDAWTICKQLGYNNYYNYDHLSL